MYLMQALNSLLFPVSETPEDLQKADALQQTIITSKCVGAMLRALQVSSAAYEKGARLLLDKFAIAPHNVKGLVASSGCDDESGRASVSCRACFIAVVRFWSIIDKHSLCPGT